MQTIGKGAWPLMSGSTGRRDAGRGGISGSLSSLAAGGSMIAVPFVAGWWSAGGSESSWWKWRARWRLRLRSAPLVLLPSASLLGASPLHASLSRDGMLSRRSAAPPRFSRDARCDCGVFVAASPYWRPPERSRRPHPRRARRRSNAADGTSLRAAAFARVSPLDKGFCAGIGCRVRDLSVAFSES
jgi:hypothetical protein